MPVPGREQPEKARSAEELIHLRRRRRLKSERARPGSSLAAHWPLQRARRIAGAE